MEKIEYKNCKKQQNETIKYNAITIINHVKNPKYNW